MLEKIPFIAALCFILLAAGSGYAAGLEQTVRNAGGLLKKGDADAALDLLREAQVDHPEAAELRSSVACALFVKGETLAESGATADVLAHPGTDEGRRLVEAARALSLHVEHEGA